MSKLTDSEIEAIEESFRAFMKDTVNLNYAIDASTRASWAGGKFLLEIFPSGLRRWIWSSSLGNLYQSPGIIFAIPWLDDDEWDDDPDIRYYDNAHETIELTFNNLIEHYRD